MSSTNSTLERAFSLPIMAVVAAIGAAIAGTIYISLSGALLGALFALAALAVLAIVMAPLGLLPDMPAPQRRPAARSADAATAAAVSSSAALTSIDTTLPPGAPIPAAQIEATETEAQLLAAGRFAEYHLAKAKRLQQGNHHKDAAYHAAASLAHGDLPEAATLRRSALAAAR